MATFMKHNWQLDVTQNWIDVTSDRPSPNERWTFTDSNGHFHRYNHGYPTLEPVVDESHWCDGHEGPWNHDPHEAIDASHYECTNCREVVEPAFDPPFTPKQILGSVDATLEGFRSDGAKVRVWVTEDEVRSLGRDTTDAVVTALLDAMPEERIISAEWTR